MFSRLYEILQYGVDMGLVYLLVRVIIRYQVISPYYKMAEILWIVNDFEKIDSMFYQGLYSLKDAVLRV